MATPPDLILFEELAKILKLKTRAYAERGETEELENLAIFHFAAGNLVEAKIYGSEQLKGVLRMLEIHKAIIKRRDRKSGEEIRTLELHQKTLLRLKEIILRKINEGEWDDKKGPSELVEEYKRFHKSATIIDEIMVVLIKEFAKAAKKYKGSEPHLLKLIMQLRI